jgi:ligand-binding sensor domain-containing protein
VALKKMTLNTQNIKLMTSEIGIMKECHHEHVVAYFDSYIVGDQLWVGRARDDPRMRNVSRACALCVFSFPQCW